ncbi:MAG: sigma-54 dependent transcriptional regulator [Pseudomonadota bacterium]
MSDKPQALVIDDEPDICELLSLTLEGMDVGATSAHDLTDARALLKNHHFDLCLTDMRLPDGNGLDLVAWMQTDTPDVPVAVITAHGNVESAVQALKLGAFDFVSKPVNLSELRKLVGTALQLKGKSKEDIDTQSKSLLGDSKAIEHVRTMIRKVARSQAPVHIYGESGTGKELVARLIHDGGPRAAQPFIPVNCGAIPTELMESEFFGHKKGSFTGAVSDKAGLFSTAEGGTLFLDEVADLPLHMQVKLLRVIQEKAVRPVGAAKEDAVDVRILSATHKNLSMLVKENKFREDLYYRINVIELEVPALRNRVDDIPLLTEHILKKLSKSMQIELPSLNDSARQALNGYAFPGNVRELENILERALTLCEAGAIDVSDIQLRSDTGDVEPTEPVTASITQQVSEDSLNSQLDDVQREAILKALEENKYNKTATAKALGISFRALRYRIKKLGLE